ncbi:Pre-mRNA-splicing factor SLU7 [Trichinella pseudospiralis]|uniref:Pre-mRNA-splicing factor SLU7 n=1 Tax=Trichinella pseudospiralis TaxID=6337 RepID=A0A0V1EPM4_TRIPS|nr:Pre-mRNA-splicing factor SLU7 [Trichinella pseudospiralis]
MATFTPQIAPSSLLKTKDATEDGPRRQTKEEYRKLKELEEARKAGTVPAMTDVETGSDINPHIPHYIAQAPWYIGAAGPTLKHQKPHPERQKELAAITQWYKRGVSDQVAQKYRKGACENCGAMTHKRKDCLERPRKIGAKYTNDSIAADEFSQPNIKLDYDAKRDRWNGFDASSYNAQAVKEFDQLEEARKKIRLEKCTDSDQVVQRDDSVLAEEDRIGQKDVDEDKYAENASMPGVKLDVDSRTRITVRNLRIREDTAKYLYNLDPNSAYYDPKSRSMRDNPFKGTQKSEDEVPFAGENFHKFTGEVLSVNNAQLFAWEAHKRGASVHALAEPTKLEVLRKEYVVKKEILKSEAQKAILEKYGGEEYLQNPDKELLYAQTENYVEYNRHGAVVKGDKKPSMRSRYEEDVLVNNHTSVWGSYWNDGEWGYACCHNKFPNSYCTGEMGKASIKSSIITSEISTAEVKVPSSASSSEHESSSLSPSEEE